MALGAQHRIRKEFAEVTKTPPAGMTVTLGDGGANLYAWEVLIDGPADSAYEGGRFKLVITIPKEYPFKPPAVSFHTKIYHPNVSNDDKGLMCLGMLRPDTWKPPNKLNAVLDMVYNLLIEPDVSDPVEAGIADVYKKDNKQFKATAQEWVRKFAPKS